MEDLSQSKTCHTVRPVDPTNPHLFGREANPPHITDLKISTNGPLGRFPPEFIDLLNRLHDLEKLTIDWKSLNWSLLDEHELCAIARILALPSLQDFEVLASSDFPLSLLRYFAGKRLRIEVTTVFTATRPILQPGVEKWQNGALTHLSLVGARNMRELLAFIQSQPAAPRSLKFLGLEAGRINEGVPAAEFLEGIVSLLQIIGAASSGIEELEIVDWRTDVFKGPQFSQRDLVHLINLRRLYAKFGAAPGGGEKSMHSMDTSLRGWLFPLLSNIPSPQLLERLHIIFGFIVPFPWPRDLHEWMQSFCVELDAYLVAYFPELKTARFSFELYNAHSKTYDWEAFNNTIQPAMLKARGVDCTFEAEICFPSLWTQAAVALEGIKEGT